MSDPFAHAHARDEDVAQVEPRRMREQAAERAPEALRIPKADRRVLEVDAAQLRGSGASR